MNGEKSYIMYKYKFCTMNVIMYIQNVQIKSNLKERNQTETSSKQLISPFLSIKTNDSANHLWKPTTCQVFFWGW